jgi:plastocyanin
MLGRFGAWTAVGLIGALVLVGCGKETKKEENPPTVTQVPVTYVVPTAGPSTPTAAGGGSATAAATQPSQGGAGQVINLDMEDIKFSTDALSIPANTDVTIHLTNKGATAHDFSIDALKISTGDVQPGASVDVKINAPAGTYTYYCNVPGHEAAGMKGTLTVK